MANKNLSKAKKAKNDEFYTQYIDIQKEVEAYLEYDKNTFKGKVVYCNCDDPYESNFFRYFVLNFNRLGLKKLITTSYKPSPMADIQLELFGDNKTLKQTRGQSDIPATRFIITEVGDYDGDGEFNLKDIAKQLRDNKKNEWSPLKGKGDFRSEESIELLKQSDIIVTNPPFSLFREYVAQLVEYKKRFLIIGNKNAVTYKEIFPLIKDNKIWSGSSKWSSMYFVVPKKEELVSTPAIWFTNLDHGRRHEPLSLMTGAENLKYNSKLKKKLNGAKDYQKYDNYDAIEVPFTDAIPSDYKGVMGVPISFLSKYNPEQFEVLGATQRGCHDEVPDTKKYDDYWEVRQSGKKTGSSGRKTNENANLVANDGRNNYFINKEGRVIQSAYQRIFIKHKKAK
ncbi:MAG: adenine-specific methyltransferase EcoRI family protein [Patescibacteria group bacterium]|jgi:hypothetical protein